jgi:hypothetical protein
MRLLGAAFLVSALVIALVAASSSTAADCFKWVVKPTSVGHSLWEYLGCNKPPTLLGLIAIRNRVSPGETAATGIGSLVGVVDGFVVRYEGMDSTGIFMASKSADFDASTVLKSAWRDITKGFSVEDTDSMWPVVAGYPEGVLDRIEWYKFRMPLPPTSMSVSLLPIGRFEIEFRAKGADLIPIGKGTPR